jgi:hypothetical protein
MMTLSAFAAFCEGYAGMKLSSTAGRSTSSSGSRVSRSRRTRTPQMPARTRKTGQ